MKNETHSESDSEKKAVDSTMLPKADLEASRLEIPASVQDVMSKIEQAQLLRAREVSIVHENSIGCNLLFFNFS